MPLDENEAIWLGELIGKAVVELEHAPGMTVEVDGTPNQWVQVIPEASEHDGSLAGFILNFPYRGHEGPPLDTLQDLRLMPPPGSENRTWENGGFARIWIRPDVPLVGLAHFVGDILHRVVGAAPDAELAVQFDYGY